jgi:glycosyltransferase involved in cell wall biosynthesis
MMKKILFLTNDLNLQLGGQELSNIAILKNLNKHDVVIINQQFFEENANYSKQKIHQNIDFRKSFIKGVLSLCNTLKFCNKDKPEQIIVSATPFSTLLYLFFIYNFSMFNKSKVIHFCRIDPLAGIITSSRVPFILYPLGLWLYRKVNVIVVQNPQMGERFKRYYRVDNKNLLLIPNPLRSDYKKMLKTINDSRVKASKPWIITITRLENKQKDPVTLIKSFKLVKNEMNSASLLICGSGEEKEKLEKLVKNLGLEKSVYFLGFVNNPFSLLKISDVFVLSSKAEGFGKVFVEAQVAGVPIVATDCPVGPRWALDKGKAGMLVPVGDEVKMSKAIIKILKNKKLGSKFVVNGIKLAERHYPENFSKNIEELILR